MPPAPANTPTAAAPPTNFWADTNQYADQDRVNALLQIYNQEVGHDPRSVSRFNQLYGANDPTLAGARSTLYNLPQGKQWRDPTPDRAMGDVNNFVSQNPIDVYNKALDQLGLGDARTRVQNLRNQLASTENILAQLEGDIGERTQNSLVTDSQRRRIYASEADPLTKQLGILGNTFEAAYGDYGDILGEAGSQTEYTMQGEMIQRQALMDRLQNAIDKSTRAEDKRRWQAEYNRLKKEQALAQQRWEKEFAEQKRQFNQNYALAKKASAASAGGGGGGGSGGGSGYGGSSGSSYSPALTGSSSGRYDPDYTAMGGKGTMYTAAQNYAVGLRNDAFNRGGDKTPFTRESALKSLKARYGGILTDKQINDIIYKEVFPDDWAR